MARKVKAFRITTLRDGATGQTRETARPDERLNLDIGVTTLEEAKARVREVYAKKGLRVRGIAVERGTSVLIAYVTDQPPANASKPLHWRYKFPKRRPRP